MFSQIKDIKHIKYRTEICSVAWAMPQERDSGAGSAQGSSLFFSNMVLWHIKSTRIMSRTECNQNVYPRVKLVTLGCGQISLNFITKSISKILFQFLYVFSQTVKIQMKCSIMLHFIRVFTICLGKKDIQTKDNISQNL